MFMRLKLSVPACRTHKAVPFKVVREAAVRRAIVHTLPLCVLQVCRFLEAALVCARAPRICSEQHPPNLPAP